MEKSYTKFWKKHVNEKKATSNDVIVNCALKAFFAKSTNKTSKEEIFKSLLLKSFTPITNKNKLANGSTEWNVVRVAFDYSRWWKVVPIFGLKREEIVSDIFGSEKRYEEFNTFFMNLTRVKLDMKKRYYTYILIDQENVEPIYQAVQAAHVAMVIGQKMSKSFDASQIYFQVCKIPEDYNLGTMMGILYDLNLRYEIFYEPDVDRVIAIGTHPILSSKRGILTKYELLSF